MSALSISASHFRMLKLPANNMFFAALLLGLVPAVLTVRFFFASATTPPIFGVYSQPNRWYKLKFCLAYMLLSLRKLKNRRKKSPKGTSLEGPGFGLRSRSTVEEMDCPQQLPPNAPQAVDAVYFVASNRDGFYFVAATARRPNRVINGFWYFRMALYGVSWRKLAEASSGHASNLCMAICANTPAATSIPGFGLLKAPSLPDTTLRTEGDMEFSTTDGLLIRPVVAMKHWQIKFDGVMKLEGRDNETVHTKVSMDWKSDLPHFDFDTDIPPKVLARSMARELWTKDFFKRLEETHQTHHEQMGYMTGRIEVDGVGEFDLDMNSMRDHSYATKRDWTQMHRYALHSVAVEDGTKFCVGIISQLDLTTFEMGYLYTPDGKMYGVDRCDLPLHCHGEGGIPPVDYSFTFSAGGREYQVECEVLESPELYLGENWEARILERMCTYKVNGRKGWGYAEWEYRNKKGKLAPVEQ